MTVNKKDATKVKDFKSYNGNPLLKRSGVEVQWTPELIEEYLKCANDVEYFVEKYMQIINVDRGLIPFHPYSYQKKMLRTMARERFTVIATARQAGKSTTTCGFILWYILFNPEKTVALLANKGDTAREILSRIQLAYQHLPDWLQQGVTEWNKGSFELENNSRVIAAATSSDNIRGYSINLLFIDECVTGDTTITVRSKKTGKISQVPIKALYDHKYDEKLYKEIHGKEHFE
jgi:hypothetical protein